MTLPAEGSGTPLERPGNRPPREMVAHDRIRLTGLLRENPAIAGFSYLGETAWPSASGSSNRPERGLLVEEGLPGVLFGVLH